MTGTMKIRCLVVDDEPPAREKLKRLLSQETDLELCGEAGDGETAIRLIGELKPDLLFIDIQMPGADGLSVLRAVRGEWLPCTIFTTAHAEHALAAFDLKAIDYLLKPYSRERLQESLERARTQIAGMRAGKPAALDEVIDALPVRSPCERFLVKTGERYVVVRAVDIVWVEAAGNYVVLHTRTGNHVHRSSLGSLERELETRRFFRTCRSAIVNLEHLREIQAVTPGEHVIILDDGTKVPLTRGLRELQDRL